MILKKCWVYSLLDACKECSSLHERLRRFVPSVDSAGAPAVAPLEFGKGAASSAPTDSKNMTYGNRGLIGRKSKCRSHLDSEIPEIGRSR